MMRHCIWALGFSLFSAPVAAQDTPSGPERAAFSDWQLVSDGFSCELSPTSVDDDASVSWIGFGSDRPQFFASPNRRFLGASGRPEITIGIDRVEFTLESGSTGILYNQPAPLTDLASAFKQGRTLAVRIDRTEVASFSLSGSARGYAAFTQCLKTLSDEPVRPPWPVPLRRMPPQPDLTPPFTPDRPAQPLAPQLWVQQIDYPSRALRSEEEGRVNVELVIGTNGRAKSCDVLGSSGSDTLDRGTCRTLLRYARWNPATNADGELIETVWTQAIRWTIPDYQPVPTYYPPPPAEPEADEP